MTRAVDIFWQIQTRPQSDEWVLHHELFFPNQLEGRHRLVGKSPSGPSAAPARTDLVAQLERLLAGFHSQGVPLVGDRVLQEMILIGRNLYQRLIPVALQELFEQPRDRVLSVLIESDETWIPWEILHPPGGDFLCRQFRMGRWLSVGHAPRRAFRLRHLLALEAGSPQYPDNPDLQPPALPGATEEIRDLLLSLGGIPGLHLSPSLEARYGPTLRMLRRADFDSLHYCGHGWFPPTLPDDASLLLHDEPLRACELIDDVANRLAERRPFVFFNACRTGQLDHALTGLGGWPQRLIEICGVGAFLAPMWAVGSARARAFAHRFYSGLRHQLPLGEAIRQARSKPRASSSSATPEQEDSKVLDVTSLAYAFWGHPNATVQLGNLEPDRSPRDFVSYRTRPTLSEPLVLPTESWNRELSPPSALLRAEYGVVPFHFRHQEIEELNRWCREPTSGRVRLYTGPGGIGKTRLALETCRQLAELGWMAGFIDPKKDREMLFRDLKECRRPLLMVLDYAESNRDLLADLICWAVSTPGPWRLLLLARSSLNWWEQMQAAENQVGEALSGPATERLALAPLSSGLDEHRESFQIAAAAFAETLARPTPDLPRSNFEAEIFERILFLHLEALIWIDQPDPEPAADSISTDHRDRLLDQILAREWRSWERIAKGRKLEPTLVPAVELLLAAITLAGGVLDRSEALFLMDRLPLFDGVAGPTRGAIVDLLRDHYPQSTSMDPWIPPLVPDVLGEQLVRRALNKGHEMHWSIRELARYRSESRSETRGPIPQ